MIRPTTATVPWNFSGDLGQIPEGEPEIFDPHDSHRMIGDSLDEPQTCAVCRARDIDPVIESQCCGSIARAKAARAPRDGWIDQAEAPDRIRQALDALIQSGRAPESCPTLSEWICELLEWMKLTEPANAR